MKKIFTLVFYTLGLTVSQAQNHAVELDGSDDYIEIQNFPDVTTNFTVTAWINTDTRTYPFQRIFTDDRHESRGSGWGFSLTDGGYGILNFYSRSTTPQSLYSPDSLRLTENTWYFVAAVADIANHKKYIYINGQLAASVTYTGSWGVDTGKASIGGININTPTGMEGAYFNGQMDDVTFWNKALTAQEIQEVMCSPADPETPGILGIWRFNEGSGTTAFDESGNGYHAVLSTSPDTPNPPLWVSSSVPEDCSVYFPPNLTVGDLQITEGTGGTKNAPFVISLSKPSPVPIEIQYFTYAENVNNNDFIPVNVWTTIPANTTQFIVNVQVVGDSIDEYAESFRLYVYSESSVDIRDDRGRCIIIDDDIPPGVRVNDTSADENSEVARVRISLIRPSAKPARIRFNTNNQTALARYDYLSQYQGTIDFAPGETSKYVDIVLLNDAVPEPAEQFRFILYDPLNVRDDEASGGRTIGYITILDSDNAASASASPEEKQKVPGQLTMKALPNPSSSAFNIYLDGDTEKPVTLRVTDLTGRIIEIKTGVRAGTTEKLGWGWKPGVYFLEVIQENRKKTLRLIKSH